MTDLDPVRLAFFGKTGASTKIVYRFVKSKLPKPDRLFSDSGNSLHSA